ncbi:hypothetical protein [Polaromonas sp.]|uniref:hypothetical protein n=1 Tax=Polaromonas sp. TaxID=1869339 RepID=UPI001A2C6031|nr:hypothetical protein [Burkholderiales bacterium]
MSFFNLDDKAGHHFSFRDFIECGTTWRENSCGIQRIDNRPRQENSWLAIAQLATVVLDPIWNKYGKLSLTYGFCSQNLARLISKKLNACIAPQVDQHASCELNIKGNAICRHLGAACDFFIPGRETQMDEAALWMASNLEFDAMYYYGRDRPLHISWGPAARKMVVLMKTSALDRRRHPSGNGRNTQGISLVRSVIY